MLQILLVAAFGAPGAHSYYQDASTNYYQDSDWWHSLGTGDDWYVSDYLDAISPFAQTFHQLQQQLDMFGYAQHVGKINRGNFLNPELNLPVDRAYGYDSDFNSQDFKGGAFKHQPQGQKFVAKPIHVNLGLASKAGEIKIMPVNQHVQADGSVLVQTKGQADPCNPSPCSNVYLPRCVVVNDVTAKCMESEIYELTLIWSDPADDDGPNDLNLLLFPATHEGTGCPIHEGMVNWEHAGCGASVSDDATHTYGIVGRAEETATLTTLDDGSKFQDYTYAVLAETVDYNLSEGSPILVVTDDDGDVVQTLAIPQYDEVTNINLDFKGFFFFGCWSSPLKKMVTTGAGFYTSDDHVKYNVGSEVKDTGLTFEDPGLCGVLLAQSVSAFNPYTQPVKDDTDEHVIIGK